MNNYKFYILNLVSLVEQYTYQIQAASPEAAHKIMAEKMFLTGDDLDSDDANEENTIGYSDFEMLVDSTEQIYLDNGLPSRAMLDENEQVIYKNPGHLAPEVSVEGVAELIVAAREFIANMESGETRFPDSYAAFKSALEKINPYEL